MSKKNQISVSEETFRKMLRDSINFCENTTEPHIKEATEALEVFERAKNPLAKPWKMAPHSNIWHVRDKDGTLIAEGNKAQMSLVVMAPAMLGWMEELFELWSGPLTNKALEALIIDHLPRIIRKARGEE